MRAPYASHPATSRLLPTNYVGDCRAMELVDRLSPRLTVQFPTSKTAAPPKSDGEGAAAISNRQAAMCLFVSQASVAIINLPVTILLARALSADGLGQFQLINRSALIAISVAHLGLPHAMAWQGQRAKTHSERSRLIVLAFVASLTTGLIIAVLGLLTAGARASGQDRVAWIVFS